MNHPRRLGSRVGALSVAARGRRPGLRRPLHLQIDRLEDRLAPVAGLDPIRANLASLLTAYKTKIVDAQIYAVNLPVIGSALAAKPAFDFAGSLATEVGAKIPSGAVNLAQLKGGLASAFDIPAGSIEVTNGAGVAITTDAQVAAASRVEFAFVKEKTLASVPVNFDMSALGNLNLNAGAGVVGLGLSYKLPLRFGIETVSGADRFYVDVSRTDDLTVTPLVDFGGLNLAASLGALRVTATAAGSSLNAPFQVDVEGTRLGSDFGSQAVKVSLPSGAGLDLRLAVTAAATNLAPAITATLKVNWPLQDDKPGDALLGAAPTVEFANIAIDAGATAKNLLAPYVGEVQKALAPIQKLSNILLARPISQLPIDYLDLIEFASRTKSSSLTDLLAALKTQPSALRRFLEQAKAVGVMLSKLQSMGGSTIVIGGFKADVDIRREPFKAPSNLIGGGLPKDATGQAGFAGVKSTLDGFRKSEGSTLYASMRVDLLEDTSNVVKLLLGDASARLVSFDLGANANLSGEYTITTLVGIIPVQFGVVGSLDVSAKFAFGYDARGLVQYAQSKNAADLVKGIYVDPATSLSFTPKVGFKIKGGFDRELILGLIRTYTGVSVPGWVLELTGLDPKLTVTGQVDLGLTVAFNVAGPAGPGGVVHVDQFPGGNVASALNVTGALTLDAWAKLNYGIDAEVPGKKIFNALGLGKIVGGLSFHVGGDLDLIKPITIRENDLLGGTANLKNLQESAPVPPSVSIEVGGATSLGADTWIIDEGALATLRAKAAGGSGGYDYSWRQITARDMGGVIFTTPSVELSNARIANPTFRPNKYGTVDNPDWPQGGFSLVGFEDRFIFEVTVTDKATGLSTVETVFVVAQDVSPAVDSPTARVSGIATGGFGVRGFDLEFLANFSDPGTQERFDATWNFGDPAGAGNVVPLVGNDQSDGIRPGEVGGSHRFANSGTYLVGLTVRDGFTAGSISKTRGTTLATTTVKIEGARVMPDQADPSKLALYVGGTNQSETIILGRNRITGWITVVMPDFVDEFDPTNVAHIYVNGQGGDDVVIFDFSNGDFLPGSYERTARQLHVTEISEFETRNEFKSITYTDPGGAVVDGGPGRNRYQAIGGAFDSVVAAFQEDAAHIHQNGFVAYYPPAASAPKLVNFQGVQSVYELSGAREMTLLGNPDADRFVITDGPAVGSVVTTEILNNPPSGGRGTLAFANKAVANVIGDGGADLFIVENPNAAAGLVKLILAGNWDETKDADGREIPDDGASDIFHIRAIGADLEALGGGGDDVFLISSTAGIDDRGHLDWIRGDVTIDAGTGSRNLLRVVDHAAAAANGAVIVTDSMITGLAPGAIAYRATGGGFAGDVDGIVLVGSEAWSDRFNIRSTLPGARTLIRGLGGDDVFFISSAAPGPLGGLAGIRGVLTIDGGAGRYRDGTPESNLRGLYSLDTVIVEGDADYLLVDAATRLVDGSPTPDATASEALLTARLARGAGIDPPPIRLISVEAAHLIGGPSANRMDGSKFSGKLTLEGRGGDDVLIGGAGDNELDGGDGDDVLIAGPDLFARPGLGSQANVLLGAGGTNLMRGGSGRDAFHADLGGSAVMIGGGDDDVFIITNMAGLATAPVSGITIDGGGQAGDVLRLVGGGGESYNQTYILGPDGRGRIVTTNNYNPAGPTIAQYIRFVGLALIDDSTMADRLRVVGETPAVAVAGANGDDLAAGRMRLTVAGRPFTAIDFSRKTLPAVFLPDGRSVVPTAVQAAPAVAARPIRPPVEPARSLPGVVPQAPPIVPAVQAVAVEPPTIAPMAAMFGPPARRAPMAAMFGPTARRAPIAPRALTARSRMVPAARGATPGQAAGVETRARRMVIARPPRTPAHPFLRPLVGTKMAAALRIARG